MRWWFFFRLPMKLIHVRLNTRLMPTFLRMYRQFLDVYDTVNKIWQEAGWLREEEVDLRLQASYTPCCVLEMLLKISILAELWLNFWHQFHVVVRVSTITQASSDNSWRIRERKINYWTKGRINNWNLRIGKRTLGSIKPLKKAFCENSRIGNRSVLGGMGFINLWWPENLLSWTLQKHSSTDCFTFSLTLAFNWLWWAVSAT